MPHNRKRPRLEDSGSPERRSPQVSNRETPSHCSHLRDTPRQGSHTAVSPTAATEARSRGVPGFSSDALSRPVLSLHSGCPIIGPQLVYGDNLGSETRKMEFKRGRGEYLKTCFLRDVRRYTCAFLNSEGGSLLVGVDNDGMICGVVISHTWEDHARQQVDSCLKMFKPPVFPHQYSLIFLPVVKPGLDGRRLRVVCLTLQSPVANTEPILYQTDIEDIYIRRDGSVEGPLSVTTAMEWLSQRWRNKLHEVEARWSEQYILVCNFYEQMCRTIALQRNVASQVGPNSLMSPQSSSTSELSALQDGSQAFNSRTSNLSSRSPHPGHSQTPEQLDHRHSQTDTSSSS